MASFNQINLLGNVGSIQVKTFSNGDKVVNATLATSRKYVDRNNVQQEDTQWHRLVIGGRLAAIAEQYVDKGDALFVSGEMTYRKYTAKDGSEQSTAEVRVREMQMLSRRKEDGVVRHPSGQQQADIFPKKNETEDFPF